MLMTALDTRLPDLLEPSKLLFFNSELPPDAVAELRLIFGRPGNQQARADNVHFMLCLMHDCVRADPRRYLAGVFLPWTGLRRRTQANREAIEADMAKLRNWDGPPDPRWAAGLYRSMVAELFDPYITIATASHQFLEGKFVDINQANVAMSERSKAEYLASRDGFSHLLDGYDPLVRNAVSHAGSHGVTYHEDRIVFKAIKRTRDIEVRKVTWTLPELTRRIEAMYECILSIEATENIFGIDCGRFIVEDIPTRLQFLHEHSTPEARAQERARTLNVVRSMLGEHTHDPEKVIELTSTMLIENFRARGMPFGRASVTAAGDLLLEVPQIDGQLSHGGDIIEAVMKLSRYAIVAEGIYSFAFPAVQVFESPSGASGAERLRIRVGMPLLSAYGSEEAGLIDILHEADIYERGQQISLEVDFEAQQRAEDTMLEDPFPRLPR